MADFNSSLPVRTENAGDVISKIADATVPSQQLTVNPDGSINITDNGGSLTVDAVDLDIRDLDSAQDSVEVLQATHDNLNANANIQVGDADVANGNPVPVSDAGGSLTVDAVDLDIRDLSSAQDSVEVLQDTHDDLNANANIQVGDTDVSNGNPVPISDAGGSITVDGTVAVSNLPATVDTNYGTVGASTIRTAAQVGNATGAADFNNGATGAQTLRVAANLAVAGANVSATNPVPVFISADNAGTEINAYNTASAIAGGASSNHDYTVTALKTLLLSQIEASASGRAKIEVQIETGVATGTFQTRFVQFNSTAETNMSIHLAAPISVAAGVRVRVIRTNRDLLSQDLYSTISGQEVP